MNLAVCRLTAEGVERVESRSRVTRNRSSRNSVAITRHTTLNWKKSSIKPQEGRHKIFLVLSSIETHVAPSGLLYNWRFALDDTCEPFALASGLTRMSLNLATPDASAFGSHSVTGSDIIPQKKFAHQR